MNDVDFVYPKIYRLNGSVSWKKNDERISFECIHIFPQSTYQKEYTKTKYQSFIVKWMTETQNLELVLVLNVYLNSLAHAC